MPLGLPLASLLSLQAVMTMAAATITVGLSTRIALFLYVARDEHDAE